MNRRHKVLFGFAAALLLQVSTLTCVNAAVFVNGGFEEGLAGWDGIGLVTTVDEDFGTVVIQSVQQAFLSTRLTIEKQPAMQESVLSFLGVSVESVQDLSAASFFPVGSAVKQTVEMERGEQLAFEYRVLADDVDLPEPDIQFFNDFAFVVITPPDSVPLLQLLGDTTSTTLVSATEFAGESAVFEYNYHAGTKGQHTVAIAIVSSTDVFGPSGLLIDNVRLFPPGDFDLDSDVDGSDFLNWQRYDGSAAGLTEWKTHFGSITSTVVTATTNTPEPSSFALAVLCSYAVLGCRGLSQARDDE